MFQDKWAFGACAPFSSEQKFNTMTRKFIFSTQRRWDAEFLFWTRKARRKRNSHLAVLGALQKITQISFLWSEGLRQISSKFKKIANSLILDIYFIGKRLRRLGTCVAWWAIANNYCQLKSNLLLKELMWYWCDIICLTPWGNIKDHNLRSLMSQRE